MGNSKLKLVLASQSPRRKELLGHLKIPFDVLSENVDEQSHHENPVEYCRQIALTKGEAVVNKLKNHKTDDSFYVVSADTIVCLNGKIFNKPANRDEAREFLKELSGNTHSVYTAVCLFILQSGKVKQHSFVDEAKVSFDHITHEIMERYLDTGDSLDKAGAYGIQNGSLTFISKVDGSYSTVVGFPLSRFIKETAIFLKQIFPEEKTWQNLF
jgi:septum formation protein